MGNTNSKKSNRTVYIEKRGRYDDERYVAVNGRRLIVKCGTPVSVSEEFAEVIEHSIAQDRLSDEFIAKKRMGD